MRLPRLPGARPARTAQAPDREAGDREVRAAWQSATRLRTPPGPPGGRLRRLVEHTLTIDIEAPARRVFEVYADVRNHMGAHSFLQRLVMHAEAAQQDVRTVDFTAFEAVPVAGVRVSTAVHVRQRIDHRNLTYETVTWSSPAVMTRQKVVVTALDDGRTRVDETLAFEANLLLARFAATRGTAAHLATHHHLKTAIETGRFADADR
ncbi:SRPBCC family protein [Kitasatospora sp. NPDC059571]|uniref:SRPBCC family protein n=1 Tax=Kitasatospora sp. NPDC059571 TaxID=3346871 RepID=UPI0036786A1B